MIICFNCSPETKADLDRLVATGEYSSVAEVISVAVANLAVLHQRLSSQGALVLDPPQQVEAFARHQQGEGRACLFRPNAPGSITRSSFQPVSHRPPTLAPLPDDVWTRGQTVPLNRWLFGQYNRLLPAKVNCRVLAHLLADQPKGIEINKAVSMIVQAVATYRDHLEQLDRRYHLDRDDAIATGFPKTGQDSEKGRLRYASQFVASMNKKGQVSSLLISLKLINYVTDRGTRLLLTEPGWRFAAMPSPLLEGNDQGKVTKFTPEEQAFLLDHIIEHVPAEAFAYRTIIEAIQGGANTPEALDAALRVCLPAGSGREVTAAFLSSQRSGAVSRMADLGLVSREREGVRVKYTVTEQGRQIHSRL